MFINGLFNVGFISFLTETVGVATPTASNVSVSGRVLSPDGRGLRNASVTLTDPNNVVRRVLTSSFGYYRFENVSTAGGQYTAAVGSRRYQYSPRVLNLSTNTVDVDFVGQ